MKTAISLPDDLYESADNLARRLGLSRSKLVATALAEFVAKHRAGKVTERLNAVYEGERSAIDKAVARGQRRALRRSEW